MKKQLVVSREMLLILMFVVMFCMPANASVPETVRIFRDYNEAVLASLKINDNIESTRVVVGVESFHTIERIRGILDPVILAEVEAKIEKTLEISSEVLSENKRKLLMLLTSENKFNFQIVLDEVLQAQEQVVLSLEDMDNFNVGVADCLEKLSTQERSQALINF